jgi:hypothetical protein
MGVNGKLTPISSGFGRAAAAPSLSIICSEIAVRGSVSRVLCAYPKKRRRSFIWDARYRTPRATYPDDDPKTRPYAVSIWSCSRRGLPCHCRYRQRGALLPHPFTLTPQKRGGLLSVALSLESPPPGVIRRRVSVEPGLSSRIAASDRPTL